MKLRDIESRLTQLTADYENLNKNYRMKNDELITMDKNCKKIQFEMEAIRRQFK